MAKMSLVRWLLMAFLVAEVGPTILWTAPQASAQVETKSGELKKKKRDGAKGKTKRQRVKRDGAKKDGKGAAKRAGKRRDRDKRAKAKEDVTTKTLAAKSGPGHEDDDGFGIISLLFIVLMLSAAGYGVFLAYKRSHPEMEWDGIRGQEDTGLRPPGKTNVAGMQFSKPKWRIFGKSSENPHPAFGEEPGPSDGDETNS